jgi:hypothetical protein
MFPYKKIGDILCTKHGGKVMFLSKYSLDRNNIISSMFRTQYIPDFFEAEYHGLQNTASWGSKDLASGSAPILYIVYKCGRFVNLEEYSYLIKDTSTSSETIPSMLKNNLFFNINLNRRKECSSTNKFSLSEVESQRLHNTRRVKYTLLPILPAFLLSLVTDCSINMRKKTKASDIKYSAPIESTQHKCNVYYEPFQLKHELVSENEANTCLALPRLARARHFPTVHCTMYCIYYS